MPTSPEEQALVDLWRQGNQEAARAIVDRYLGRLLQLARRHISQRLVSRVDPEDIVQSVFRTFFCRLKDGQFVFADQDDLCKLLVRITLHKTLRQVAFHKAAKRDPGQEADQGSPQGSNLLSLLDQEPTPEASIAFLDQLEHLLSRLGPAQRQIIELRLQGYTNEEIAQQLGVYDRKIRRALEEVRSIARREGINAPGEPVP